LVKETINQWGNIMNYTIETEQEEDGRWIAEVMELPGVIVYGGSRADAIQRAEILALRLVADRLEHGEAVPDEMKKTWPCQPGSAKHIPHWMAPDFNAPLDDFREYME
jgi:predicted RNase H-like HicB family nuclease